MRIALLAVNIATGIIVARALAPAGRGEQAAMSLWPLLVAGLSTFGLPSALGYFSRRSPEASGRLFVAALLCVVPLGLASAVLAANVLPLWLHGYNHAVITEARWLLLLTPQCLLTYVVRAHLESRGEFTRSNLSQLVPSLCTLLILIVLAPLHRLTPASAPLAYLGPGALQTLWLVVRLRDRFTIDARAILADARRLFSYGLRGYGVDIIGALSTQIDQALITLFLVPHALGLYAVALSASRVLNITQQALTMVLFPRAAGLQPGEAVQLISRAARLSNALSIPLGAAFIALLPLALPLVYGRAFSEAIALTQLLTVEAVLSGFTSLLCLAFPATGRPFALTLVQLCWLSTTTAALLLLVPRMGIQGAAFALLASAGVRFVLVLLLYRFVLGTRVRRLLPDGADIAYLLGKIREARKRTGPVPLQE